MTDSSNFNIGTVVVIGWIPKIENNYIWPEIEFKGLNFTRMFVLGEKLSFADVSGLPENVIAVKDEAVKVFQHNLKPDNFDGYYKRIEISEYSESCEFLKRTDSLVSFVCFDKKLAASVFELASLVKTETLQNRLWLIHTPLNPIKYQYFCAIPDIFLGPSNLLLVKDRLPQSEKMALKWLIKLGINHLRMFLRAGYNSQQNIVPVDGWALQIASPWLSLVISLNKIVPGFVDTDISRELFDSSAMRKLVCDKTLCALGNYFAYAYDGEKVTADTLLKYGDNDKDAWESEGLWKEIFVTYATDELI